jgi:DNA-binding GntR family transcriptional regulator
MNESADTEAIDKDPAEDEQDLRRAADSSERAYNIIRKQLVEFKLRPEARINEVQLARSLGVSRTPIREALNRLASEGFVSLTPNRGFFVRSLSTEGMIDLYEIRSIIECAAFRLMCERASDEQIGRLRAYWDAIVEDYQDHAPDVILAEDEGFHLLIAELSGNPELVSHLAAINARIRFIRRIHIEHRTHDKRQIGFHSAIVEAALKRDVAKGVEFLRDHIEMSVSATQEALKDVLLRIFTDGDSRPRSRRRGGSESAHK